MCDTASAQRVSVGSAGASASLSKYLRVFMNVGMRSILEEHNM